MARGGKRQGAGRPKGALNKATADVRALAAEHGPEALGRLLYLMKKGESETVQLGAANSILDRAYGKPAQALVGDSEADPVNVLHRIERVIVGPAN